MRGLWLEDGEIRFRDDLPVPEPPPGEALVRVLAAGVCGTDLELVRGYYPFRGIPGHEFVGRVERGAPELQGRRVVGEINAVCGRCRACRGGLPRHCQERTVLGIAGRDGAFADYLTLPAANLHPVPDPLSDDVALFAEPVAAALEVQEQVAVRPGDRVLVVGDGRLGQLVARTLVRTGCDLTVVGRHREKLRLLAGRGIATLLGAHPPSGFFDLAVDCTGHAGGFTVARSALRSRGTLVMKSTYAGELTVNASSLVVDEITLVGSRCGPFPPALRLLASGCLGVEELIHARYGLRDGGAAFEHARRPGVLKVLLEVAEP